MQSSCCHTSKILKIGEHHFCQNVECDNCFRVTKRVSWFSVKHLFLLVFFAFNTVSSDSYTNTLKEYKTLSKPQEIVEPFSQEVLEKEVLKVNPSYLNLCLGQCKYESGMGTSPLFKKTNNLFGLTVFSVSEPHIDQYDEKGRVYHFKVYQNWKESFYDWYNLVHSYQEEALIQYMSHSYCQDPGYVTMLRSIINNLKRK